MKILFTGGSSFTGYWFIHELAAAGHEVFATFTRPGFDQYDELRASRVSKIISHCTPIWNCSFGDETFLKAIKQEKHWDLICHHGAYVQDYKSLDFNVVAAVQSNTHNLKNVLQQMADVHCNRLLLTGSVFERDEGKGEHPLKAFSPYGLSKGLTAEIFKYWCQHFDFRLAKFVIPNPFGPLEEKRFTAYLINNWLNGNTPSVNTPDYVRDNIHISLLAKAYCQFAETQLKTDARGQLNPCGYIESQGEFAQRLATEMQDRLGKPCELKLMHQEVFDEPKIRVNYDSPDITAMNWNEIGAWDDLAEYYLANQEK